MGCEAIKSVDSKIIKQIYLQYDNYIEDVKYSEYIIFNYLRNTAQNHALDLDVNYLINYLRFDTDSSRLFVY